MMKNNQMIIAVERIERAIYLIRGQKVMIDRDLAKLYGVETRVLNQAVWRNQDRFPNDFMVPLTRSEIIKLSPLTLPLSPVNGGEGGGEGEG